MSEKLTKAQARALDLIAEGTSRLSHLKMERVGRVTIDRLSEMRLIETRFPGAVYITEAGRNARAALTDREQGEESRG